MLLWLICVSVVLLHILVAYLCVSCVVVAYLCALSYVSVV